MFTDEGITFTDDQIANAEDAYADLENYLTDVHTRAATADLGDLYDIWGELAFLAPVAYTYTTYVYDPTEPVTNAVQISRAMARVLARIAALQAAGV